MLQTQRRQQMPKELRMPVTVARLLHVTYTDSAFAPCPMKMHNEASTRNNCFQWMGDDEMAQLQASYRVVLMQKYSFKEKCTLLITVS